MGNSGQAFQDFTGCMPVHGDLTGSLNYDKPGGEARRSPRVPDGLLAGRVTYAELHEDAKARALLPNGMAGMAGFDLEE